MRFHPLVLLASTASLAAAQVRPDLYRCEGCEAIHEHSHADLPWTTRIGASTEPGEAMILEGTVVRPDGVTRAPGVVIYAYHTNAAGVYPTRGGEQGWERRHGYLRGWVRTNDRGEYRFETIRPGAYPGRTDPAHVHLTIKEPDRQEYWIDEVVFEDDPHVTPGHRARLENRGGSGVVRPTRDGSGRWLARRDITLER